MEVVLARGCSPTFNHRN